MIYKEFLRFQGGSNAVPRGSKAVPAQFLRSRRHAAAPCGMHFVVALPGAWFAPAGSPAKKARAGIGVFSSAGGGWWVVYARWIVVGTVHWCLAAIAAPTGSLNPAPTFRGYTGLNGMLSCRWVGSRLRPLEWLWCVLVGWCSLTGRGAAFAALLVVRCRCVWICGQVGSPG